MSLNIPVTDIFHINGRGTVVTGNIKEGSVRIGQMVVVISPGERVEIRVSGLEVDKKIVSRAIAGQFVGLMLEGFEPAELLSGLRRTDEGQFEVVSLAVVASDRRWWQFW